MYRKNTSRARRVSGKISITLLGFLILGSLILPLTVSAFGIKEYQASIDALTINDVDFTAVPDGSYPGRYETKMVSEKYIDSQDPLIGELPKYTQGDEP